MLYLAIDQHRKQLTVNLRNESGDVLLKRQVSTEWPRVRKFLADIQKQSRAEGGFVAILEGLRAQRLADRDVEGVWLR